MPTFNLIYIDGDHHSASVLEDAVLAFPLLKQGGALVFDDYRWHYNPDGPDCGLMCPRHGIEAFFAVYRERLHDEYVGYQVHLQKVSDDCDTPSCGCRSLD